MFQTFSSVCTFTESSTPQINVPQHLLSHALAQWEYRSTGHDRVRSVKESSLYIQIEKAFALILVPRFKTLRTLPQTASFSFSVY